VSKFDLRDVSKRLSESGDTEAVVFEFLGYLQGLKPDWRASLAFYEVSRDSLVCLYLREDDRLVRRDLAIPADQLPARLVRKFFHPSAFHNAPRRRSLLASLFKASPYFEPDATEAAALRPLVPVPGWNSCVCLPLADQDDLLAMLVLASTRKDAFRVREIDELMPVKSMAAMALAQHLYRASRSTPPIEPGEADPVPSQAEDSDGIGSAGVGFQERIRFLDQHAKESPDGVGADSARLEALAEELERVDRSSSEYRAELLRVKDHLNALEEQSTAANQHLNDAYSQLTETRDRMGEMQRTVGFLQDLFQMLSQEHDTKEVSATIVMWFSEHFGIERCSLMVLDGERETMRIAAHRGLDPEIADRVRVRVGQGISGWVAHSRKPLFVRVKSDAHEVRHTGQDVYNSDSFITVPLVHGDRVVGVLNLSNKAAGLPFDQLDLDRATLIASLLAMTLGAEAVEQRSAAWA